MPHVLTQQRLLLALPVGLERAVAAPVRPAGPTAAAATPAYVHNVYAAHNMSTHYAHAITLLLRQQLENAGSREMQAHPPSTPALDFRTGRIVRPCLLPSPIARTIIAFHISLSLLVTPALLFYF